MEKKMNKKWLAHIIAVGTLATFVVLGLASASTPSAKKFENVEALKGYLDGQPANNADTPLKVAVTADDSTLKDTVDVINSAGKYVNLDLSDSALTTIPPDIFKDCIYITSIALPNTPDLLKSYLNGLPANTPDKPIRVSMAVNDQTLKSVGDIIRATNKYVIFILNPTSSVSKIPDNAFKDCKRLVGIGLPNSVTEIGDSAFANTGLTSVNIPYNVTKLTYNAFWGCENLTAINVSNVNGHFCSALGVVYTKPANTVLICPPGKTGEWIQPNGIAYIAPYAFYGSSISSVTIHGDVNLMTGIFQLEIGEDAFTNCTKLTKVTISGIVLIDDNNIFDGNFYQVSTQGKFQNAQEGTYTREIGSNTWSWTK